MLKIIGWVALILIVIFTFFVISFIRSCNKGFGYQAGSGFGSLVDMNVGKYDPSYERKYADTFFAAYPQYKAPPEEDDFLHMTNFYFDTKPREEYSVQWEGTGFLSIRKAYDYETRREIIENPRLNAYVDENEKLRIEKRFRTEVLNRIDSIIAHSKDKDSAIFVPGN